MKKSPFLIVVMLAFCKITSYTQVVKHIVEYSSYLVNDKFQSIFIDDHLLHPEQDQSFMFSTVSHLRTKKNVSIDNIGSPLKIKLCENALYTAFKIPFNPGNEYYSGFTYDENINFGTKFFIFKWKDGLIQYTLEPLTLVLVGTNQYILKNENNMLVDSSGFIYSIGQEGITIMPVIHGYYDYLTKSICPIHFNKVKSVDDNVNQPSTKGKKKKKSKNNSTENQSIEIIKSDFGTLKRFVFQNQYGYVKRGNIIIPAKFTEAKPFRFGRAKVCESQNECYTINKKGKCIKNCP